MHTVPERVCPWEGKVKVRQLQGIVFQKARNALVDEMLAWGGAAKIGQETADMALRNGLKGASLAVKAMEESADKRPDPPLLKRAPKRPVPQPAVVQASAQYRPRANNATPPEAVDPPLLAPTGRATRSRESTKTPARYDT